ncbi:sugar phosphate isomerase/epimerase [Nitritalea halalkaliphila LW7]|uniref:Sugar phosphate isomerase/epimerase n=1 Tax=Nitritalea halalkaliphila LW7 TaxID=1189621 RepID=I5C5I2_9BACT|nr:sugar phosphate isomerase/epimerase [Nitritalea halalkaliphila]EIM77084.1 sugar phosphate isomerase/epimerase [Nitritalea halalkaliphila LW7]
MRPTEFKGFIDGLGLQVRSAHVMGPEFDPAGTQYATDFWKKAADDHAVLGATYLVKPAMPVPETKAALAAWVKYYDTIGAICAERGLKFGFHNHDWEFRQVGDVRMLDFLIEETNPELVTFELDVYWCQKAGVSPVEFMEKHPGRFELLHIKDEKEIGESGEMDFASIFHTARKAGGMRHYFVEVERYNYEPMESIERSFNYLAKADYV